MPHTFTAHPDHPAVAYLARLHADLGGQLRANKVAATKLANDMRAVEAVLKMFDPDYNVRAISARRRVTGNPRSKRRTLFRIALDVLRAAPDASPSGTSRTRSWPPCVFDQSRALSCTEEW